MVVSRANSRMRAAAIKQPPTCVRKFHFNIRHRAERRLLHRARQTFSRNTREILFIYNVYICIWYGYVLYAYIYSRLCVKCVYFGRSRTIGMQHCVHKINGLLLYDEGLSLYVCVRAFIWTGLDVFKWLNRERIAESVYHHPHPQMIQPHHAPCCQFICVRLQIPPRMHMYIKHLYTSIYILCYIYTIHSQTHTYSSR